MNIDELNLKLRELQRERVDMLAFIREQVELWDNAGDSGFPLYEQGKRILERATFAASDRIYDQAGATHQSGKTCNPDPHSTPH